MPVRTPMPSAPAPNSNGPWVNHLGALGGESRNDRAPGKLKSIFEQGKNPQFTKASFAGAKSKTAELPKLHRAQELAAAGVDDQTILNQTGWFRGADREWRSEIDDSRATLTPFARYGLHVSGRANGPASTILHHPELYEAYPELRKIKTRIRYDSNQKPFASFTPDDNLLDIRANPKDKRSPPELLMLHDLMHGIQLKEGFARGGSPENLTPEIEAEKVTVEKRRRVLQHFLNSGRMDAVGVENARREIQNLDARLGELTAKDAADAYYNRLMGEVEAYNVEARKDFPPERRLSEPPWETEGKPRDIQIYR